MKIAVLGASGYIGSRFIQRRLDTHPQDRVVAISRLCDDVDPHERVERVTGDVSSLVTWLTLPDDVDVVVHAAGPSRVRTALDQDAALDAHFVAAQHVREWVTARLGLRAIYLSSMHVYGPTRDHLWTERDATTPALPYARLKLAGERACGVNEIVGVTALRLAHVWGVGTGRRLDMDGVVHRMLAAALSKSPIDLDGDGLHVWDFVHVDDVCDAIDLCLDRDGVSGLYNIGSGPETIVGVLAEIALVALPSTRQRLDVRPNEHALQLSCAMDSTKARLDFGWGPYVTFTRGLLALAEHLRVDVTVNVKTTRT